MGFNSRFKGLKISSYFTKTYHTPIIKTNQSMLFDEITAIRYDT